MAANLKIFKKLHFIFGVSFGCFCKVADIHIHFFILCWIDIWRQQGWISSNTKKSIISNTGRPFLCL